MAEPHGGARLDERGVLRQERVPDRIIRTAKAIDQEAAASRLTTARMASCVARLKGREAVAADGSAVRS